MSLLYVSGTNSATDFGSPAARDNLLAATFLLWIFPTSVISSDRPLVAKGLFAGGIWTLNIADSTTLEIFIRRATVSLGVSALNQIVTNTWQFVGGTYDVNGADTDQKLFRGTLSSPAVEPSYDTQSVGSGATFDNSSHNLYVGNNGNLGDGFPGRIAFVAIYNRQLSLAEVRAQQFHPWAPIGSGCVLFSHLGLHGATTQYDLSSTRVNGTASNVTQAPHAPIRVFGPVSPLRQEVSAATKLIDNFDDNSLDAAKWTSHITGAGATLQETNQRIVITPILNTAGFNFARICSVDPWDLTGERYSIQVTKNIAGAETAQQFLLTPDNTPNDTLYDSDSYLGIVLHNSNISFVKKDTLHSTLKTIGYNSIQHRYISIRESGGTTFWDTSPDGSNWTNQYSMPNPIAVNALYVILRGGTIDSSNNATTCEFDSLNVLGNPINIDLPTAELAATADVFTPPGGTTGIFVNLPVATTAMDPGQSLGVLHDLESAQITASAQPMQASLGTPGAIFINLPVASTSAESLDMTVGTVIEVDLPVAEFGAIASELGAPISVSLPTATIRAVARSFNNHLSNRRRRVLVLILKGGA